MKNFFVILFFLTIFMNTIIAHTQNNLQLEYELSKQKASSQESFSQGYYYYNNMAYEAAISLFRTAIAVYPKNDLAQYWLGRAYLMAGYSDLAVQTWEALLQYGGGKDLFLQQELDRVYTKGFSASLKEDIRTTRYAFLRMFDTKSNPSFISVDNNNNFYVSDFYKGRINIYDASLKKIKVLKDGLKNPINISFSDNLMIVSDFGMNSIRIYDMQNNYKLIHEFGEFGFEEGKIAGPVGIAIYRERLYLVDQGNNRIQVYNLRPKPYFLGSFGKRGSGKGEFHIPSGIAIHNGQVWVTDRLNQRLQVFDLEGNYIKQLRSSSVPSPIQVFEFQDKLYVVDQYFGLFVVDEEESDFILMQKPTQGLDKLTSAWIDRNGILFMSEVSNPTVIAYAKDTDKLSSLNVSTTFITTAGYPKVVMKLRIRDTKGVDIKGLNDSNITVEQDGYKKQASLKPLIPMNDKSSISIVIRNTIDSSTSKEKIISYINRIIDLKKPSDKMRIITYNNSKTVLQDFTENILELKEAISKISWNKEKLLVSDDSLDKALYESLDSNEFNDSHGAVLLIDNNKDTEFTKYSEEVIANHAEAIGVPIYVVNLDADEKNSKEKSLRFIAKNSGGDYFSFNKSNNLYSVLDIIREKSPLFYTLSYTNPPTKEMLNGYWASVVLKIEYRTLYGVDKVGYLVNI